MEILDLPGPLFPLGRLLATPGAIEILEKANQQPWEFLAKHARGEWGDLDAHDISENQSSPDYGLWLLSGYTTAAGDKLWIITHKNRHHRIESHEERLCVPATANRPSPAPSNNNTSLRRLSMSGYQKNVTNPARREIPR
jgi:hypothetical protein